MLKYKFIDAHMKAAEVYAELSSAKRLHVGAIIVKDDRIISIGYNGMPSGWTNECEDVETTFDERDTYHSTDWRYDESTKKYYRLKTKKEVLHAESNCISKLAKNGESSNGAALFVTHAPCMDCAKLVYQSGITVVYYRNEYRSNDGLDFLKKCGVKVEKV